MNHHLETVLPALLTLSFVLVDTSVASAQIIPDASLGDESSVVTPSSNVSDISGGSIRGENLFHSFESFNVGEGLEARFDTPQDVSRIFSRVTGSSASEILGTLSVEGAADLFFLNENGILFGAGSALDLNGSLTLSTAQTIEFSDGIFSSNLNLDSILSEGIPEMLSIIEPGLIRVENAGRIPTDPTIPPSETVSRPINNSPLLGLSIRPQTTLAFVASNIYFDGAIVRNNGGRVSLTGTRGVASISTDTLGYFFTDGEFSESSQSGTVHLSGGSLVEVVGSSSGEIVIDASQVTVDEISTVISANYGGNQSYRGGIEITAERLVIGEENGDSFAGSNLFSQSINGGRGGDVVISVDNLEILGGGAILVTSSDTATGGDVLVSLGKGAVIDGENPVLQTLTSSIVNAVYGSGQGGNITLAADTDLFFSNGGSITTSTINAGKAGDVYVSGNNIYISGLAPSQLRPAFIGSVTGGTGDSGNVSLEANIIRLSDSGSIGTSNLGLSGEAKDVSVVATELIEIEGFSSSPVNPTGFVESAIISSSNITDPTFQAILERTGLLLGNAGNVYVEAPHLLLRERGAITVQNDGRGNGGNIELNVTKIEALEDSVISASTAGGQGGNVDIISRSLLLADGSSLEAAALSEGNGGNLTVESLGIGLVENARISANAEGGRGGSITLSAGAFFDDNSGSITATSALGPQFDGVVTIESPDPSLEESSALPTEEIAYPELALACNTSTTAETDESSLIITGTGGTPVSIDSLHRSFDGWNPSGQTSQAKSPIDRNDSQAQGWVANSDGTYRMVSQSENSQITISSASRSCTS